MDNSPVLVVGIGNLWRGDDAAGLEAARRVAALNIPGVTVRESGGDGAALMESWRGFSTVVLVDAVSSGAGAGTLLRFDAGKNGLPASLHPASTHLFGIAEAVELARSLGRLPPRLIFYGIEGGGYETGSTPSDRVLDAVRLASERIARFVRRASQG